MAKTVTFGVKDGSITGAMRQLLKQLLEKKVVDAVLVPLELPSGESVVQSLVTRAEVLDADAFSVFEEKGIFNKETATSFYENILKRGGTEHPMILYNRFRGQEPTIEALLKRSGVK